MVDVHTLDQWRKSKIKGQPLLGHRLVKYAHFTPLRGPTEHVKDLLEIPESDTSQANPVEADKEILKAEKFLQGKHENDPLPEVVDTKFKKEAKEYMKTPNETPEASYQAASKRDPVAISVTS